MLEHFVGVARKVTIMKSTLLYSDDCMILLEHLTSYTSLVTLLRARYREVIALLLYNSIKRINEY